MSFLLAQVSIEQAEKGVGVLDKIAHGSVALILLVLLLGAIVALVWQYRRNVQLTEDNAEAAKKREEQNKKDAADLIAMLRKDADAAKTEQMNLMRERLQAEKESDVTLASTVRTVDHSAEAYARLERVLLRVEALLDRMSK